MSLFTNSEHNIALASSGLAWHAREPFNCYCVLKSTANILECSFIKTLCQYLILILDIAVNNSCIIMFWAGFTYNIFNSKLEIIMK